VVTSNAMSRVKTINTAPELSLRRALNDRGLFEDQGTKAPAGRPDIVLATEKLAIFIDGCFWHGCPLHYARPRTRGEFWANKLITNLERDARISQALTDANWGVIRVWEHEIVEDLDRITDQIEEVVCGERSPAWHTQGRLRRVVEIGENVERREFVLLNKPGIVTDTSEGRRVTAKARAPRLGAGP
jgi:DNA mismatch endonuclease (patch repair protein)